MERIQLYNKISTLPSELKSEVLDFIEFLLSKRIKDRAKKHPKFGSAKGKIDMSPDFDEPLEDFKDYN